LVLLLLLTAYIYIICEYTYAYGVSNKRLVLILFRTETLAKIKKTCNQLANWVSMTCWYRVIFHNGSFSSEIPTLYARYFFSAFCNVLVTDKSVDIVVLAWMPCVVSLN